jgi:hypothetical protein
VGFIDATESCVAEVAGLETVGKAKEDGVVFGQSDFFESWGCWVVESVDGKVKVLEEDVSFSCGQRLHEDSMLLWDFENQVAWFVDISYRF